MVGMRKGTSTQIAKRCLNKNGKIWLLMRERGGLMGMAEKAGNGGVVPTGHRAGKRSQPLSNENVASQRGRVL